MCCHGSNVLRSSIPLSTTNAQTSRWRFSFHISSYLLFYANYSPTFKVGELHTLLFIFFACSYFGFKTPQLRTYTYIYVEVLWPPSSPSPSLFASACHYCVCLFEIYRNGKHRRSMRMSCTTTYYPISFSRFWWDLLLQVLNGWAHM